MRRNFTSLEETRIVWVAHPCLHSPRSGDVLLLLADRGSNDCVEVTPHVRSGAAPRRRNRAIPLALQFVAQAENPRRGAGACVRVAESDRTSKLRCLQRDFAVAVSSVIPRHPDVNLRRKAPLPSDHGRSNTFCPLLPRRGARGPHLATGQPTPPATRRGSGPITCGCDRTPPSRHHRIPPHQRLRVMIFPTPEADHHGHITYLVGSRTRTTERRHGESSEHISAGNEEEYASTGVQLSASCAQPQRGSIAPTISSYSSDESTSRGDRLEATAW